MATSFAIVVLLFFSFSYYSQELFNNDVRIATIFNGTSKLNNRGDAIDKISTSPSSAQEEVITYGYTAYDNNGNWLQQTSYNNKNKPHQVVKENIIYY